MGMARFAYECSVDTKGNNTSEGPGTIKPVPCHSNNICLYCCCEPQCCFLIQRNTPKHFWEAWYFWLGVALLILFIISSVASYIISNCRHNLRTLTGHPASTNSGPRGNPTNEISIHVIPTTGALPSHRKLLLCAPDSSASSMTPVVA
ncbi:uncharacterized protein [Fopius arisanus]|uniref:Opal1_0 protein n=1 Tax=Fopius arisanus TaxID=64838 RepID=A0A0C9QYP7_9HYME|nr:PREDICTED: uncharacterized protein LOC105273824 [Fopius arisanus]XP_011314782.1 PREDICTED: uncharacterized protein LOC105273824 [Fopius arisanus]XP_011314783.1 PREDICTED: uncharacterized protein LOC105273824 [Fopius arisanus]